MFLHAIWLVALLNALILFRGLLTGFQGSLQTLLGAKLQRHMTEKTFDKVYTTDLKYFENPEFYDKLSRAASEAGYRPMMIVQLLVNLLQGFFVFSTIFIILFGISRLLVLVLSLSVIPMVIMEKRMRRLSFDTYQQKTQASRKMGYVNFLFTGVTSIRELKIFRLREYLKTEYNSHFHKNYAMDKSFAWRRTVVTFLTAIAEFASSVYSYIFALLGVLVKRFGIGDFSFIIQSFSQCQTQVQGIINNIYSLYENHLFINNYFEFQALPSEIEDDGGKIPGKVDSKEKKQIKLPERVEKMGFKDVSFHYPAFERQVLNDISFELKSGEVTALLGENGAGKTTIMKLLCRFYDPVQGAVLLNGQDIKSFDLAEYRKRIGIVFQDFTRYYFTVGDNISFGAPWLMDGNGRKFNGITNYNVDLQSSTCEESPSDVIQNHIVTAARASGADTFINKLPSQYNNILGRLFDGGTEISYGEWQKLGLSRALFGDKDIILLDEPFSHQYHTVLDQFFEYIAGIKKDRIFLLITHDPTVASRADRVIDLSKSSVQ